MANATETRLPEIGEYARGHGVLVEIQDVTPPPPPVPVLDYIFEESTAKWEVRANGTVLADGETYTDFYGLGTCVEHAVEAAKRYAAELGESSLEVVVVKTTVRYRKRPGREENFYDPKFRDFHSLGHGSRWNLPEEVVEEVFSMKTGAEVVQS